MMGLVTITDNEGKVCHVNPEQITFIHELSSGLFEAHFTSGEKLYLSQESFNAVFKWGSDEQHLRHDKAKA